MKQQRVEALDLFKEEIESLCEEESEPCTKGDLLEAMRRLNELLNSLVDE